MPAGVIGVGDMTLEAVIDKIHALSIQRLQESSGIIQKRISN